MSPAGASPVDLSVRVGALTLPNPVLSASGCFGYGLTLADQCPPEALGAVVTKGLSPGPRQGNAAPRIVETAAGMINAIGLENIGVEAFVAEVLPELRRRGARVVCNVFGTTVAEYLQVARALDRAAVDAIELNVSCPNVKAGGAEFGLDPDRLGALVAEVRAAVRCPLWVKLSPNGDVVTAGRAAAAAGADALTLINSISALFVDHRRPDILPSFGRGGLSGPAIKPIALRMVHDVVRAVEVPVIGVGGISCWQDALEFLLVGAAAVQVGTAVFRDPQVHLQIIRGLEGFLREKGWPDWGPLPAWRAAGGDRFGA